MSIFLNFIILFLLFAILAFAADVAVRNIKYLAGVLRVRLFALGILLGLITTLPELFLGINAMIDKADALTIGNIFGSIIVILSLILGVSLIFNRKVSTSGRWSFLLPVVGVIFFPVLLGLDGKIGLVDGLIMIGAYVGLIFYLYRLNHFAGDLGVKIINKNRASKAVLYSIAGVLGVLFSSHWVVEVALNITDYFQIKKLVVGLLIFSIGTNLPEISIAITSYRKKSAELSLSHLLSSAFSNILVLGILSFARPIIFIAGFEYWIMMGFLGLILFLFTIFYRSGKEMDWREGIVLLAVYFLFIATSFYFGILAN